MSLAIPPEMESRLQAILQEFPEGESGLLPALWLAQETFGAVTPEVEALMAERLGMDPTRLHQAVSFYHMFHRRPSGRHLVSLCDNLSCHLAGSTRLLERLCSELGIRPGETTQDGAFTLEVVECLGACHQAPALQIDYHTHGPLEPEDLGPLLQRYREQK